MENGQTDKQTIESLVRIIGELREDLQIERDLNRELRGVIEELSNMVYL